MRRAFDRPPSTYAAPVYSEHDRRIARFNWRTGRGRGGRVESFQGKVAVVTGAASGIGRALVERFAAEGMKVVLADVEADALAQAERDLRAQGAEVLAVGTDVSQAGDVEAL